MDPVTPALVTLALVTLWPCDPLVTLDLATLSLALVTM